MSTSSPISDLAAMLDRLSIPELQDRLDALDAERATIVELIRVLRARQSTPRKRKADERTHHT